MTFQDRAHAGRLLAQRLLGLRLRDAVVLALPRGGVPVAAEVADALGAPLDLVLVRKIGAPAQPELAVGAIAEGVAEPVLADAARRRAAGADDAYIEQAARAQQREIARRRAAYLHGRPPLPLAGRTAIVVDDGIATGATMQAALAAVRRRAPGRVVLAVPVAPPETVAALRGEVDDLVCLVQPVDFVAVGAHYEDFDQVSDDEVAALLRRRQPPAA